MDEKFKQGTGCFKCEYCGKLTRQVDNNHPYCVNCKNTLEHENLHVDNDFKNDDCGDSNCPLKHYVGEERWWKK